MMSHIANARVDLLINDSNKPEPSSRIFGRRKLIDLGPEDCNDSDTERETTDQDEHTDIVDDSSDTSDDQYGGEEEASKSGASKPNNDDDDTDTDDETELTGAHPTPQPSLSRTTQTRHADDSTGNVPTAQTAAWKKRRQKLQR